MTFKQYVLVLFVAMVVVTIVVIKKTAFVSPSLTLRETSESKSPSELHLIKLIQQWNNISRQLNLKQQKLGQLDCEKQNTSETGGWCKATSTEDSGEHSTDKILAAALAQFFKDKTVASFGDGPGRYKQLILGTGKVNGYDAYDGAPFCEVTSDGRVQFLDLTLPQYGLPLYDWVVSLEVAEHIPAQFESVYIDNIVRHAKEGVILSWAVPGQVGYSHINNKPFEYVKNLFDGLGFTHDEIESRKLRAVATLPWLKTNTNVYRRRDLSDIEKMKTWYT